jgi:hypothetical protein
VRESKSAGSDRYINGLIGYAIVRIAVCREFVGQNFGYL